MWHTFQNGEPVIGDEVKRKKNLSLSLSLFQSMLPGEGAHAGHFNESPFLRFGLIIGMRLKTRHYL